MSRISPYFEGENSALCNPINKMDDNTNPVECVRNPAAATTMISISANFAQTTIFRFLYIFANRPANGGKQQIRYHQCYRCQRHHHRLVLLPHPSNANKTRQRLQEIIIQNSQIIREKQENQFFLFAIITTYMIKTQQPKSSLFSPEFLLSRREKTGHQPHKEKATAWRIQK